MDEEDVILQFRMWEQGRIDLEELQERLQNILENALWEVVTEYFMMPNDITTSISIENITLGTFINHVDTNYFCTPIFYRF